MAGWRVDREELPTPGPRWAAAADKNTIAAVQQVFALLNAVAEHGGAATWQIAAQAELTPRLAQRLLRTAAGLGYLQENDDRWTLTTRVFELGAQALRSPDLLTVARPAMRALADATDALVQLGLRDGGDIVHLHRAESRDAPGLSTPMGHREPLRHCALGLAVLAWDAMPGPDAELEAIRAQGYSLQRLPHLCSLAMPVFDLHDEPIAGLALHVPLSRLTGDGLALLLPRLRDAANAISAALGGSVRLQASRSATP